MKGTSVSTAPAETYDGNMATQTLELTAQDRCDRCGAPALARAEKDDFTLDFCNHHLVEARPNLEAKGWRILVPTVDSE